MLITLCVQLCECLHDIYTYISVQQTNSAEGITKHCLPLKARNMVPLGEILKRHLFEELGIQGA